MVRLRLYSLPSLTYLHVRAVHRAVKHSVRMCVWILLICTRLRVPGRLPEGRVSKMGIQWTTLVLDRLFSVSFTFFPLALLPSASSPMIFTPDLHSSTPDVHVSEALARRVVYNVCTYSTHSADPTDMSGCEVSLPTEQPKLCITKIPTRNLARSHIPFHSMIRHKCRLVQFNYTRHIRTPIRRKNKQVQSLHHRGIGRLVNPEVILHDQNAMYQNIKMPPTI